VTRDIEEFGYNTAIAKMMEALNKISNFKFQISNEDKNTLIKLLAPFAPYITEELWSLDKLGIKESVHTSQWPVADKEYLKEEKINIPVAINGKVRGQLIVEVDAIKEAKELEKIKPWLTGKEIVKEIYVPGKMINLVIR